MSAITGIFYRDGRGVNPDQIKKMNNILSYRGKDGSGVWVDGPTALGHQMLYTTNESILEQLPSKDKSSGIVITADARIDNRDELAPILKLENSVNVSDSFFILKAYQKWGENCPEKLFGDFTFVIWDTKNEKMFCARDHIGVKPFYYYLTDNAFFFATEIKALLTNPEVKYSLNETKLAYFLSNVYDDREITFYENILRLPAATKLMLDSDNFELQKYWGFDINKRIILKSEPDYSELFLKIFNNAVQCRLRSAYPLGALLSGGLDSSSIVCTIREILLKNKGYPLKTFSLIFEETPEADERNYIDTVLKKGFINPHYVNADDYSPVLNLNKVLWQNDEPIRSSNLYYNYLLNKLAKNEGVRILLEGYGGDSTISYGKGLLIDYLKKYRWKQFFKEVTSGSKRLNQNMIKFILNELVVIYPELLSWKSVINNKNKILKKEFASYVNLDCKIESFTNDELKNPEKAREFHFNSINSGLLQYTLEESDKISAVFNIESRYPFLDVHLMEFCLAIPSKQKRKYGWDRFLLRQSMINMLPKEIQWRKTKKTGLKSNMNNFMNYDKEYIENVISNYNQVIQDYVGQTVVQNIYQEFKNKKNPVEFFNLWNCVSLGLWMNHKDLYKNHNDLNNKKNIKIIS